jgi:hypothetical protein
VAGTDLSAALKTELDHLGGGATIQADLEQNPAIAVGATGPPPIDDRDDVPQRLPGRGGAKTLSPPKPAGELHGRPRPRTHPQPFQNKRLS